MIFCLFLILSAISTLSSGQSNGLCRGSLSEYEGRTAKCRGEVIFEDGFNSLDLNKWKRTVTISGEDYDFVTFTSKRENSFIQNGRLIIKPSILEDNFIKSGNLTLTDCTGEIGSGECQQLAKFFSILPPIESAQLCTDKSFNFKYGTVTVRAKLPAGDWLIPQIWLKPSNAEYGQGYLSGKVRIASARGNAKLVTLQGQNLGSNILESGILLASKEGGSIRGTTVMTTADVPWHNNFHNYTLNWTPESMSFYVDGRTDLTGTVYDKKTTNIPSLMGLKLSDNPLWKTGSRTAPFDQQFYICLGVTAGGGYGFPDNSKSNGKTKPWENLKVKGMLNFWMARDDWMPSWSSKSRMEVDHIEVTAL